MSSSLIIVESPLKARTISRFFDRGVKVVASMGHVRDLPEKSLGIEIRNNFQPRYQLTANGKKVLRDLRKDVSRASEIYLATDPDREGEAIAWHLQEMFAPHTKADFLRVSFHEITAAAVRRAFTDSGTVDIGKVDAQQARRILDRLVGYKVSPLLWKHVGRGTSAGRVQSVALRLVCEREREILNFKSEEYWNLIAHFSPPEQSARFSAQLFKLDGRKPRITDAAMANRLAAEIEDQSFVVSDRLVSHRQQRAAPPFITSTLQQFAGARLRMTTRQTMIAAQQLYEGVELGDSGATGLITYMRTDSFSIAREAQEQAREYIGNQYGAEYLPAKPNVYRARRAAQEAHEAIRPTDVTRTPEIMASYLSGPQLKLYRLIWQRFVASQMGPARLRQTSLEIKPVAKAGLEHDYLFRSTVTETLFPGFLKVFRDSDIDTDDSPDQEELRVVPMPELNKGDSCLLRQLDREQSFTQPPNRFSEATLVRELEQNGVGRPSTYASIVNTVQERNYVERRKSRLIPTELGFKVNDYLVARLDRIFQVNFTAEMENQLDAIEEGRENMLHMLDNFYRDFVDSVTDAELLDVPESHNVQRIIELFPADLSWREPVRIGKKTYDDEKFLLSLKEQFEKGEKPFSDRQWRALLALAALYSAQLPGLDQAVAELGIAEEMRQLIEDRDQREQSEREVDQGDPAIKAWFDALSRVEWQPPRKHGARVYDDRKFFSSLKEQWEGGRRLSPAQRRALDQLVLRYRDQIAGFDQLVEDHSLQAESTVEGSGNRLDPSELAKIEGLLSLAGEIREWKPARKVRGRTFDDREFIDSLRNQFQSKGALSVRQLAALRRTLAKYRHQLPDYVEKAEALGLPLKDGADQRSEQENQ